MIYLNHNAATPMTPAVLDSVNRATEAYQRCPDEAAEWPNVVGPAFRSLFSDLIGGTVVVTSGGTEATAMAIVTAAQQQSRQLLMLASVLDHATTLTQPVMMDMVGADPKCQILREMFRERLLESVGLVALTAVNSEVGAITDVTTLSGMVKEKQPKALVYVDACQAPGRMLLGRVPDSIDMISVSSHKLGGPPGLGAIWFRNGVKPQPALAGGFSQRALRGGLLNGPALLGFAAAMQEAREQLDARYLRMRRLRDLLDSLILRTPEVWLNCDSLQRICNTSSYHVKGVVGKTLALLLRQQGVIVSDGSREFFQSAEVSPLMTYLYPDEGRLSNVRFSLSHLNTEEEVKEAADVFAKSVKELRELKIET